jgi:hypothetical protein
MRRIKRLARTLFVENRTLTGVVLLFFLCAVCAISTGFWLAWRLSYIAAVGIPVAYIWSRINLRGIEVIADRSGDRLQEGADYEERITVNNKTWLTKIWLEIDDPSDMPGHHARRVVTVPARDSRTFRVKSTITRRGLYAVGPVLVRTGTATPRTFSSIRALRNCRTSRCRRRTFPARAASAAGHITSHPTPPASGRTSSATATTVSTGRRPRAPAS